MLITPTCSQPWIPSPGCSGVPPLGSQLDQCHRAASLGRQPAASSQGAKLGGSKQTLLARGLPARRREPDPRAAGGPLLSPPPGDGGPGLPAAALGQDLGCSCVAWGPPDVVQKTRVPSHHPGLCPPWAMSPMPVHTRAHFWR